MSRIIRLLFLFSAVMLVACGPTPESKADLQEEENKAIVQRHFEAVDEGNLDEAYQLVKTDFVVHYPGGVEIRGLESLKEHITEIYTAFPDLKHIFEELIAEDDKVVARYTIRGTHKGEFMGIAPTGKQVMFTGVGIFRIAEGKFIEAWIEFDRLGLMQQLGMELKPKEVEK